ncbi:MAG: DUF3883 domain-containing protein [Halanaerobiales bacterium]|nr:DUF3883 domain-containing protein [Halanaerobiales bacterium]
MEIGRLGEAYVYEYECKELKGTHYIDNIDVSKALDSNNGYDILSYTRDGNPIHIEVKATTGTEDKFYLSKHEFETAKRMAENGLVYLIYFVKEIISENPKLEKIKDITQNNNYKFEETSWKVSKIPYDDDEIIKEGNING